MKYLMKVTIESPNKDKEKTLNLKCFFTRDEEGYGKKTWLSIYDNHGFEQYLDLRYDEDYHRGKEEEFLKFWATNNYWNGKGEAWSVKSLSIEEVK